MTLHSELGNGFQEVIYQRALEFEMSSQGIDFSREQEMPTFKKWLAKVGYERLQEI